MTNAGNLVFGVYAGRETLTAASPRTYNDGSWHLMTATFSARTGLQPYVDDALVARNGNARDAEPFTGYFRVGFDNLGGWPNGPTSNYFSGSVALVPSTRACSAPAPSPTSTRPPADRPVPPAMPAGRHRP